MSDYILSPYHILSTAQRLHHFHNSHNTNYIIKFISDSRFSRTYSVPDKTIIPATFPHTNRRCTIILLLSLLYLLFFVFLVLTIDHRPIDRIMSEARNRL